MTPSKLKAGTGIVRCKWGRYREARNRKGQKHPD
jgi:hypothetical protein